MKPAKGKKTELELNDDPVIISQSQLNLIAAAQV